MKTIQLSLQVADDITSINQLEQYVDHLGQSESQSDSSPSTCPSCKKQRLWLGATELES